MSSEIKCRETSTEDTYDLSSRSKTFNNTTWVSYILLFIALVTFYVVFGNIMHPSKNKIPQVKSNT